MFKKLLGSLSKEESAVKAAKIDYAVPESMPNLNPELDAILPKVKLPDAVKKKMNNPAIVAADPSEAATGMSKDVAAEIAADTVAKAVTEPAAEGAASGAGEALAKAAEDAGGDSSSFLASILTDPRFAIIGVNFLALGLKKETAILWAVESTALGYAIANEQKKDGPPIEMSVEEEMALNQARAYANGEEVFAEDLSELALEAGMDKPGAVAAQAAAWDIQPPPPEAGDPDVLIGDMVSASVLLAAALTIPKPDEPQLPDGAELAMVPADAPVESANIVPDDPREAAPAAKQLKPFIDKGLELAAAG